MTRATTTKTSKDEGAALLLVLGFVVFMSAITGGLVSYLSTTIKHRVPLDAIRAREYAADGAIEFAIGRVRALPNPGKQNCATGTVGGHYSHTLNATDIRVNCRNANTTPVIVDGNPLQQTNIVFTACVETGVDCDDSNVIIQAQVNFQMPLVPAGHAVLVSHTYIQSWSVSR
jgi:hypothetical protein